MTSVDIPLSPAWALTLTCDGEPVPGPWAVVRGEDGSVALDVTCLAGGAVQARYTTLWDGAKARFGTDEPLVFTLDAPEGASSVRVEKRVASVRLYADGLLSDEDWILGEPAPSARWTLETAEGVRALFEAMPVFPPDPVETPQGPAQYWSPRGHNVNIGDCMPFAYKGAYHLYCLYDRRHHGSQKGMGAHQWAHLSTDDLVHWTPHPMAIDAIVAYLTTKVLAERFEKEKQEQTEKGE